jgi:hypothetical protein
MADTSERQANITIEAGPAGLTVRCEYTGSLASIPQAIERLRSAGVLELVQASAPVPAVAAAPISTMVEKPARKAARRVEPAYNGAGEACCPVHHKPLAEGRYGLYCPAKAQPGDAQNDKGYCSVRFTD